MPVPIKNRPAVHVLMALAAQKGWKINLQFSKSQGWFVKIPGKPRMYVHKSYDKIVTHFQKN